MWWGMWHWFLRLLTSRDGCLEDVAILPVVIPELKLGHKSSSLANKLTEAISSALGTLISRMSRVMAMAMTPSLKDSTRPVSF
jgi:hypothetical protein